MITYHKFSHLIGLYAYIQSDRELQHNGEGDSLCILKLLDLQDMSKNIP
jgi:hypothetical protein